MSEVKNNLAEKGSWDDFSEEEKAKEAASTKQSDRPKTLYMDTSKPGKYQVRPVGPHIKCRKSFKPYRATLAETDKDNDPAWKAGFWPQKRFAINVIDRADGLLKVLEKGASVFSQFANYKAVFGKNPSDAKDGVDFLITVTVPKLPNGQPNKLKTDYKVMHLKETPLTKEEIDMIKAKKLWPLTEIYKPTSLEKRQELWDALPEASKIAPKKDFKDTEGAASEEKTVTAAKPSAIVEEVMTNAPADTEDLFEEKTETEDKSESADLF